MKKLLILSLTIIAASALSAVAGDAKTTYEQSCAKCHGVDGKGDTKMGHKLGIKNFTDTKLQTELKDDVMFKAIKDGVKDKDDKTLMKPVEGLSDGDINGLIVYLRTFKK